MEKITYQKPEFKFNDLYLFDGIANKCWGYGHVTIRVYKDLDGSGTLTDGDDVLFYKTYDTGGNGKCNAVAELVRADLAAVESQYKGYLTTVSGNENSQSLSDNPLQDFIHS